jgi:predicted GNAT superfamily acetyltransferase
MMSIDTIEIRLLYQLEEMHAAVELQRTHWGEDEESVIPAHMLFSLASFGGHVIAAFDGDKMVGVLIGFLGTNIEEKKRPAMANLQIVSKRMVVDPAYRRHGIGYRLKIAQRDFAMQQGVRLVVWTFDPLQSLNAHLNIRKLGAISKQYVKDYYGISERGGLAPLGSSDRLVVEWWVTNRRVEERLTGTRGDLQLSAYLEANTPVLNPTTMSTTGLVQPCDGFNMPVGTLALLEVPTDYNALAARDEALARQWRAHTRDVFLRMFAEDYVVTDFLHESYEGRERSFYLLSYNVGFDYRLN